MAEGEGPSKRARDAAAAAGALSMLMVGAGEYNVGYVPTAAGAAPDKRAGVTAIVLMDLRRRGRLGRSRLRESSGAVGGAALAQPAAAAPWEPG